MPPLLKITPYISLPQRGRGTICFRKWWMRRKSLFIALSSSVTRFARATFPAGEGSVCCRTMREAKRLPYNQKQIIGAQSNFQLSVLSCQFARWKARSLPYLLYKSLPKRTKNAKYAQKIDIAYKKTLANLFFVHKKILR